MEKNKLLISKIILVFIIIISFDAILGTTKYLLSLKKLPLIITQPTPKETITTIPLTSTDSSNLKTYRNDKYDFGFQYKNTWQLEQQNNSIKLKPISENKPEEISISVNAITDRPKDYTLAGWLLQNGNNNASCDSIKKIGETEWCTLNSERFEAVRIDDYTITKNAIDYDIKFRVAYGRQKMDYYIPDKELSEEIDSLNQILSTFQFTEK